MRIARICGRFSLCVSSLAPLPSDRKDPQRFAGICKQGSLVRVRPQCTRLVGPYDENIWPAYYEDVDYDIRLRRVGIAPVRPLSEPLEHEEWTTTRRLENAPWLADGRERNRRYVIAKWGADWVGGASYREPFDGHPPAGWSEKR